MLRLFLRSVETFNEDTQEFETIGGTSVDLEHSLYTVSKWEEIHKEPFGQATVDIRFVMGYLECMCVTENIPSSYWACLTHQQLNDVMQYIQDPHTAHVFNRQQQKPSRRRTVTAELIYCWMITLNIPIEFEHWHFNRLMTLIEVCTKENAPKKPMTKAEKAAAVKRQRELNAARRAKYNSKG